MASPPPPQLVDDVIPEILVRLPPDEPKWLFRAALACKPWLRTVINPTFLHRYRTFHGAPPLLGLIDRKPLIDRVPRFVATTGVPAFSFLSPAVDTTSAWPAFSACALDCRHGRALIRKIENGRQRYFVCDPVTGDRHRVPRLGVGTQWMVYDAFAIFCGVNSCQHLDCHGGPFYVVFMFRNWLLARTTMSATIYSSETGACSMRATLEGIPALEGIRDTKAYGRGALIGDEIYFMLSGDAGIVKYDWGKNSLSVVNRPPAAAYSGGITGGITLMVMEDCSLGLAGIAHTRIYLWSRRASPNSDINAEWVQYRVIDLENMMPIANPRDRAQVVGFAEGVGVIFITTGVGLFMMELKSGKVKKIGKPRRNIIILPYMSFYTPDLCRLSSLRVRLVDCTSPQSGSAGLVRVSVGPGSARAMNAPQAGSGGTHESAVSAELGSCVAGSRDSLTCANRQPNARLLYALDLAAGSQAPPMRARLS